MSKTKKIIITLLSIVAVILIFVGAISAKMYTDVAKSVDKTFAKVDRKDTRQVDLKKKQPFSVLLMGIDTGELGRIEQGRSDSMMVATVNPNQKQTTIVSIPRDTYTEIVGRGTMDKINHAYAFGGVSMSMDTVQKLLDIPIDHYISINMKGLEELVDAVGGVEVNNTLAFSYEGNDYPVGTLELNGQQALGYTRMRYDDPNGDYGRQERQRKVITAIGKKLASVSTASKYQTILKSMEDNVRTDLTFEQIKTIVLDYSSAFDNVVDEQMKGEGVMRDGVSYQDIPASELNRIQTVLKKQLEIEK
ncbi:transcriptional regulator [Floricoccus penangensis]|uniref:Transcriptional regulator n=1 Tax=Floricoccus penangensis TaxID=1859475 RepID=A0A9Q5NYS9_9LACT|nr:LCP family protein [Floricoccus penangensis]OFI45919.1 transcriptional regulator [Floricoccus penangensis]